MNVSSCWSASRHMNSSFSLRRFGVMSLSSGPGSGCAVAESMRGDVLGHRDRIAVLLDQLADVVATGPERAVGENGPATEMHDENAGSL